MKTFDTVHRYSDTEFTGVPIAKLFRGVWYWPEYTDARDFARAYNLPTDRVIPYKRGWAIQMQKGGTYVSAPVSR